MGTVPFFSTTYSYLDWSKCCYFCWFFFKPLFQLKAGGIQSQTSNDACPCSWISLWFYFSFGFTKLTGHFDVSFSIVVICLVKLVAGHRISQCYCCVVHNRYQIQIYPIPALVEKILKGLYLYCKRFSITREKLFPLFTA